MSVVVPFVGPQSELEALLARLARLRVVGGDEIVVADNRPPREQAPPARALPAHIRVIDASAIRSPGHARNAGAHATGAEWILFIDDDTMPADDLLDAYFDPPPGERTAVVAGRIEDVIERPTAAARYVKEREKMDQRHTLTHPYRPYAQTANCLVRRAAFDEVDGFEELVRSGEDTDLCWRMLERGWELEERRGALVGHACRDSFRALVSQVASHGRGTPWLNRRFPGSFPPPTPRQLAGRVVHYSRLALRGLLAGDGHASFMALADLVVLMAFDAGRVRRNVARRQ